MCFKVEEVFEITLFYGMAYLMVPLVGWQHQDSSLCRQRQGPTGKKIEIMIGMTLSLPTRASTYRVP